jgi:hypothetical protein
MGYNFSTTMAIISQIYKYKICINNYLKIRYELKFSLNIYILQFASIFNSSEP